ncbi:hypothetical protein KAR91_71480 [Candidatus Pacearchaeota archaeon]|nr:hypothetical protein [Candidatus Pacearchaeota archaeon]
MKIIFYTLCFGGFSFFIKKAIDAGRFAETNDLGAYTGYIFVAFVFFWLIVPTPRQLKKKKEEKK